jgi:nucleoside-triphosphatase THEP1
MKSQHPRLYVLTGNVHTGKTTVLRSVCRALKDKGICLNGLLSLSLYSGSEVIGYDGFDLAAESLFPLARTSTDSGQLHVGRFHFFPEGHKKACQAILHSDRFDLTVVDEMGPLELRQKGYWHPVTQLLHRGRRLLLVIRKPLLPAFTEILSLPDVVFDISQPNLEEIMIAELLKEMLQDKPQN